MLISTMIVSKKCLMIRNLRGNWSLRLLYEFFTRSNFEFCFGFIDLSHKEYFPPAKKAPIIFNSKKREKIQSKIFFNNSLPKVLLKEIIKFSQLHKSGIYSVGDFFLCFKLLANSNSDNLFKFSKDGIPYGQFISTCLISKYGIKHVEINKICFLDNLLLFLRFVNSFRKINNLVKTHNYSQIVLINGRDVVGAAAHLVGYINCIEIVCLENGISKSILPKYSCWNGNMHHWMVKQKASENIMLSKEINKMNLVESREFLNSQYGLKSKWWGQNKIEALPNFLLNKEYFTFYVASETESTTFPTSITKGLDHDQFDQSKILKKWYEYYRDLEVYFVIRLHPHPRVSNRSVAYDNFFKTICKDWNRTYIFDSQSPINSYSLAENAKCNFVFRSSIGPELSSRGVPIYYVAPQSWTSQCPDKLLTNEAAFLKVANDLERPQKFNSKDFETYANYLKFHSTDFKSFEFEVEYVDNKRKKIIKTFLRGKELDIPRFKFINSRN